MHLQHGRSIARLASVLTLSLLVACGGGGGGGAPAGGGEDGPAADPANPGENVAGHALSGTVTTSGNPLSGVTVTLAGPAAASSTTGADGRFSFPGLADGDYTVSVAIAGYTFPAGASRTVTLAGADADAGSFAAEVILHSISGTVRVGGATPAGATVTLFRTTVATAHTAIALPAAGPAIASTTTDASGRFTFTALSPGSYTVSASLADFSFGGQSVTLGDGGIGNCDLAAQGSRTISGTLSNPGTNVTVQLRVPATPRGTGAIVATVTPTGASFSFTGVPSGSYDVTFALPGGAASTGCSGPTIPAGGGDVPLTVAASCHQTVSGTITGAPTHTLVSLSTTPPKWAYTAADGSFSITDVELGTFQLTVGDEDTGLALTGAASVTVGDTAPAPLSLATRQVMVLYVTSKGYSANLGGSVGADETCRTDAAAASAAWSGCSTIRAVLSYDKDHDAIRIGAPSDRAVVRPDGALIQTSYPAMFWALAEREYGRLQNPVKEIDLVTSYEARYWTGTQIDGSVSNANCNGWTSTSGLLSGEVGNGNRVTYHWVNPGAWGCDAEVKASLLCACW